MKQSYLFLFAFFILRVGHAQISKTDTCIFSTPTTLSINDEHKLWQVYSECPIKEFHVEVYNRWGIKIYESDKLEPSNFISWEYWNCKDETYFWMMKLSVVFQDRLIKKSKSGPITLVKASMGKLVLKQFPVNPESPYEAQRAMEQEQSRLRMMHPEIQVVGTIHQDQPWVLITEECESKEVLLRLKATLSKEYPEATIVDCN